MEYVRLGSTGLKVSRLCLGCMTYGSPNWRPWVLGEADSRPFIRHALEQGITFFDTADVYSLGGSEEVLGRALKELARRDAVVIATKVNSAMGDGPNERHKSLDRRDNWMRNMKSNHLPLGVEHKVRLAIAHRPFLAGRLSESLPRPISRRFLRHKCYRRLDGSLQNGTHYTANRGPDRGFVQYSSAFQLVMAKRKAVVQVALNGGFFCKH